MNASRNKPRLLRVSPGPPRGRKQARANQRDDKTAALYCAACDLLAANDFDSISVARFARKGGCSVGALYGRFADKNAFLRFVIARSFRQARDMAERDLSDAALEGIAYGQTVRTIVEHVSSRLAECETAGIVRAAIKLGFADPKAREPFDEYRNAVTDRALELLAPHLKRGGEDAVREAMQIVLGSLTDAILVRGGLFQAASLPSGNALCSAFTAIAKGWMKPTKPSAKAGPKETPKPRPRGQRKVTAI